MTLRGAALPISPSGPLAAETLDEGLAELDAMGIPWGFAPGGRAAALAREGWFAGDDSHRAGALLAAADAGGRALWMARGGYGAVRTLEALGEGVFDRQPVELWGFSDGTVLLAAWDRAGWPAWMAPPLSQLARLDEPSRARVRAAWHAGYVEAFEPGLRTLVPGRGRGPLGGGNLCVLVSTLGTPWAADLRGRVVILEDTGEPAYKIDRMFTQLRLAGALEEAAALVLAGFTAVTPDMAQAIEAYFVAEAPRLGIPVAWGLPIGHDVANAPLPWGRASGWTATLEARADGTARLGFERAAA